MISFYSPFPKTTNFRLIQNEIACRRQFYIYKNGERVLKKARKHYDKNRNCSLGTISPFPTLFSKNCTADTLTRGLVWERVNFVLNKKKKKKSNSFKLKASPDDKFENCLFSRHSVTGWNTFWEVEKICWLQSILFYPFANDKFETLRN